MYEVAVFPIGLYLIVAVMLLAYWHGRRRR
jgi:hypothetical protein